MTDEIVVREEHDPELESFLGDRLYEFNSSTTGINDGRLFIASIRNEDGEIIAGVHGHTWGGTCEVSRLWVHESMRNRGLGTRLMLAVEAEAMRRRCKQMVLSTHSFQAPVFYEGLGFKRVSTIPGYPKGFEQYIYIKSLAT